MEINDVAVLMTFYTNRKVSQDLRILQDLPMSESIYIYSEPEKLIRL